MSWQDRVREAAYTSPSGARTTFFYEDVREQIEKRTSAFEFPDADGTYVQDLGKSGRRHPMRAIFWGDNYDSEASGFMDSLGEAGVGKLEHPIYGVIDCVPFGAISRRDRLTTGANEATIEVTFWETIDLIYPTPQTDPGSQVLQAVSEFNEAVSEEFNENIDVEQAAQRSVVRSRYQTFLDATSSVLRSIADTQDNVRRQFDAIESSINQSIDILIGEPLTLAFQTTQLIQSPARALTTIVDRLEAYADLTNSIISGDGASVPADPTHDEENEFYLRDLYAETYATGSVVSVVNNQFETKTGALEAAEFLLGQLDTIVEWRDGNYENLDTPDTGTSYQQLQEAIALAAGFLVEISFTLKQERRIVLDRARTIVDLAAELYGSVDDQLDFLINTNGLSGSEIIELPAGREIVYYV